MVVISSPRAPPTAHFFTFTFFRRRAKRQGHSVAGGFLRFPIPHFGELSNFMFYSMLVSARFPNAATLTLKQTRPTCIECLLFYFLSKPCQFSSYILPFIYSFSYSFHSLLSVGGTHFWYLPLG